jgi:hypothetical protein
LGRIGAGRVGYAACVHGTHAITDRSPCLDPSFPWFYRRLRSCSALSARRRAAVPPSFLDKCAAKTFFPAGGCRCFRRCGDGRSVAAVRAAWGVGADSWFYVILAGVGSTRGCCGSACWVICGTPGFQGWPAGMPLPQAAPPRPVAPAPRQAAPAPRQAAPATRPPFGYRPPMPQLPFIPPYQQYQGQFQYPIPGQQSMVQPSVQPPVYQQPPPQPRQVKKRRKKKNATTVAQPVPLAGESGSPMGHMTPPLGQSASLPMVQPPLVVTSDAPTAPLQVPIVPDAPVVKQKKAGRCWKCAVDTHATKNCKAIHYCLVCDSGAHPTIRCPVLKLPRHTSFFVGCGNDATLDL